jgi:hypothetical protein
VRAEVKPFSERNPYIIGVIGLALTIGIVVGAVQYDKVLPELDPDRGLFFSATARIVRYGFAVHRLSGDPTDTSEPERVGTALFVHRNPEHEVRYLELTALAAKILERLLAGETLRLALDLGTRDERVSLDAAVLEGTARVLSDLAERGAVLGAGETGNCGHSFANDERNG